MPLMKPSPGWMQAGNQQITDTTGRVQARQLPYPPKPRTTESVNTS